MRSRSDLWLAAVAACLGIACTKADIVMVDAQVNETSDARPADAPVVDAADRPDAGADQAVADASPPDRAGDVPAPDAARDTAAPDVAAEVGPTADARSDVTTVMGVTPAAAGELVITEMMVDTDVAADDFGEWFELYNPSATATYDLRGCVVSDLGGSNHVIGSSVIVPPRAYVTLGLIVSAMEAGFLPNYTYAGVKLSNDSADGVKLTCGQTIVDQAAYQPIVVSSGRSLSLDPDHLSASDNDVPTNWCASQVQYVMRGNVRDYGTPGVANPQCQ